LHGPSILFRLQPYEWAATSRLLDAIFTDTRLSAAERLGAAMRAFPYGVRRSSARLDFDEACRIV
jgi:hypothetical protein